jgi:ubiquinol-cytochrome c reductase cytochrome b subunit
VVGRPDEGGALVIGRAVRFVDSRSGAAPLLRKALRYVFPDHWSFLLGEVALYAFVVLVATGVYLTLFFEPSLKETVYHGSYGPLRGAEVSEAYRSVHHWAANVFVAAIVLHLMRVFFTGAFRKPREGTYLLGLLMLLIVLPEGYLGYSMADDLLSGMGLAIGYGVAQSVPFFGANLALLLWGGPYPGDPAFMSRMFITHVLILPVVIGALLGLHLTLVASRHHTQFRRAGRPRASAACSASPPCRATRRARSGCCSRSRRCSSSSAGWCRSTRSGSGARTRSATPRTAHSRTGIWAG